MVLFDQVEEIEALSSIYGDEWCVIDEASRIFCIKISDDISDPRWSVCLQVIKSDFIKCLFVVINTGECS